MLTDKSNVKIKKPQIQKDPQILDKYFVLNSPTAKIRDIENIDINRLLNDNTFNILHGCINVPLEVLYGTLYVQKIEDITYQKIVMHGTDSLIYYRDNASGNFSSWKKSEIFNNNTLLTIEKLKDTVDNIQIYNSNVKNKLLILDKKIAELDDILKKVKTTKKQPKKGRSK